MQDGNSPVTSHLLQERQSALTVRRAAMNYDTHPTLRGGSQNQVQPLVTARVLNVRCIRVSASKLYLE